MKNKLNYQTELFDTKTYIMTALFLSTAMYLLFYDAFKTNPGGDDQNGMYVSAASDSSGSIDPFTSVVPTDITNPADSLEAAAFAWKEFVAITWPGKTNSNPKSSGFFRGMPAAAMHGSTGAGGTVVWETYYHRDELYPGYYGRHVLPNADTTPNYIYHAAITTATPGTNTHLFNNLDETSEINLAYMYYTPLVLRNNGTNPGIFYEAKGNNVMYNFVKANGYNNLNVRNPALQNSIKQITNMPTAKDTPIFNLPNGTLEIKATWRHYDAAIDTLQNYHWAVSIYYSQGATSYVAHNDTFLLLSLHIIQKTPNVPTFTFATFEHVGLDQTGFRFVNTHPMTDTVNTPRPLPDSGVIIAARQFPIPGYLNAYNAKAQNQIRKQFGKNDVWANYRLVGVQAVVQDDPGGVVPPQQFFLSNFATETNDALQFFQGGLSGTFTNVPNPDAAHVFVYNPDSMKFKGHTAGGCLGCHGSQGQFAGGDFSVISATGNNFKPDVYHPYPKGSTPVAQNPNGFPLPHQPASMQVNSYLRSLPGMKKPAENKKHK